MINWKFEGYDVNFVSTLENHDRHISNMLKALKLNPDTKIIYTNGDIDKSIPTDAASISSDTSNVSQSTVSMGTENISYTQPETTELPSMSSNVDNANPELNTLELFDTANDFERSGNFDVDQPDGQDTH